MATSLPRTVLRGPIKPFEEIEADLDFTVGDITAKHSRFWLLLVLSAVIASAGVMSDSTATVIGAMIVAPLATPIQSIAHATVTGRTLALSKASALLAGGTLTVIAVAIAVSIVMPELVRPGENSQITGRVSPTLIDMLAATATGFAGALGIARRDISDILPGVAIAISLVPPLAVVGITLTDGLWADAIGAFTLFTANVLAIIVTASIVFAAMGMKPEADSANGTTMRRARIGIGVALALVSLLLLASTAGTVLLEHYSNRTEAAAKRWANPLGFRVTEAKYRGDRASITVYGTKAVDPEGLLNELRGEIPDGTDVTLEHVPGTTTDLGEVGGS